MGLFDKYETELNTPLGQLAKRLAQNEYDLIFGLIQLRIESGLTQSDVAEVLGISQQAVAKFESMDSDPRLSTISQYAMAINALIHFEVKPFAKIRAHKNTKPSSRANA